MAQYKSYKNIEYLAFTKDDCLKKQLLFKHNGNEYDLLKLPKDNDFYISWLEISGYESWMDLSNLYVHKLIIKDCIINKIGKLPDGLDEIECDGINSVACELDLFDCPIRHLKISNSMMNNLITGNQLLTIAARRNNVFNNVDLSQSSMLDYCDLTDCNINKINLTNCHNLETLKLHGNSISALDISDCENLITLLSSIDELKTINGLQSCKKLRDLYLENSQLTELNINDLPNLYDFTCCGSANIINMHIKNNCIQSLSFLGMPKLKTLILESESLHGLTINTGGCISELDISKCPNLYDICILGAKIKKLKTDKLENVEEFIYNGDTLPKLNKYIAFANLIKPGEHIILQKD